MAIKRDFLLRTTLLSIVGVFCTAIIIALIVFLAHKNAKPTQDSLANHIPRKNTVFFLRTQKTDDAQRIIVQASNLLGVQFAPPSIVSTVNTHSLYEFAIVKTNSGKTLSWVSEVQTTATGSIQTKAPLISTSDEFMAQELRTITKNQTSTLHLEPAYQSLESNFIDTSWLLRPDAIVPTSDRASILLASALKNFSWIAMMANQSEGRLILSNPAVSETLKANDEFPSELQYVSSHPTILVHINNPNITLKAIANVLTKHQPLLDGITGIVIAQISHALGSHITADNLSPLLNSPLTLELSGSGSQTFTVNSLVNNTHQTALLQAMQQNLPAGSVRHIDFSDNKRDDVHPFINDNPSKNIGEWHVQTIAGADLRGPLTIAKSGEQLLVGNSGGLVENMIRDSWAGSITPPTTTVTPFAGGLLSTQAVQSYSLRNFPFLFEVDKQTLLSFFLQPFEQTESIIWSAQWHDGSIVIDWRKQPSPLH